MPPKKADIFSKDIEFILIDLVECRPILWDYTSELYKRIDLKDAVWEEVAHSLGPHFSGPIVASRFKSMRDTFMSNLRRVKESKRSGKGTTDIYIPKWFLYDRLKFLQKTVIQSTSTSNLNIPSEKFDDTQIEQTLNESLKQCLPHRAEIDQEKEVITEELPAINIYYNDSMEKFMIASTPTEELSDSTTDLSVLSQPTSSAFHSSQPISTPVLQTTLQNETISMSTASTSSVFTSSASKIKDVENKMYIKRGYAKRKANFDNNAMMAEAVTAIKTLCKQDSNNPTNLNSSVSTDSAQTLGLFIAAKLREMTTEQRKLCENEILKVLSQF